MPYQQPELYRTTAWIDSRPSGTPKKASKLRGHPLKPETRCKVLITYLRSLEAETRLRIAGDGDGCRPPLPLCPRRTRSPASFLAAGQPNADVLDTGSLNALRIRRKDAHQDAGNAAGLQWNHDLSAMDTCLDKDSAAQLRYSFNGAMTFQPWIPVQLLAPSPCFNGAMTFQPWIHRTPASNDTKDASMEP